MVASPFKPINWAPNEIITEEKMDQLVNNTQWLKEYKPEALYTLPGAAGTRRDTGIKIVGGRAIVPPNPKNNTSKVAVRFGEFFTPRTQPIITTGYVAAHRQTFVVINGINSLIPDATGFEVEIVWHAQTKKKVTVSKTSYMNWIALGF